jgi:hypothetical protein
MICAASSTITYGNALRGSSSHSDGNSDDDRDDDRDANRDDDGDDNVRERLAKEQQSGVVAGSGL